MINKILSTDNSKSLTNSKTWGNHNGEEMTYTGRYAIFENDSLGTFSTVQNKQIKNANDLVLLTTGASDYNKAYNLYDVAGNVFEFTHEIGWIDTDITKQHCIIRGGSYHHTGDYNPACFRGYAWEDEFDRHDIRFRVMLYMK